MTRKEIKGITLDGLRGILPFAMVLVSLVLAWASLNSYLSLLSARVDSINEKVGGLGNQLDKVEEETRLTKEEVIRLSVIIEGAQSRGQISGAFGSTGVGTLFTSLSPSLSPTPVTPLPLLTLQERNYIPVIGSIEGKI